MVVVRGFTKRDCDVLLCACHFPQGFQALLIGVPPTEQRGLWASRKPRPALRLQFLGEQVSKRCNGPSSWLYDRKADSEQKGDASPKRKGEQKADASPKRKAATAWEGARLHGLQALGFMKMALGSRSFNLLWAVVSFHLDQAAPKAVTARQAS